MSEELEKQEGQKTVVAFISGLLIGGLLVWVFSSSPEKVQAPDVLDNTNTEEASGLNNTSNEAAARGAITDASDNTIIVGDGSIVVDDQPAGNVVVITELGLPTEAGWIGVQEVIDGVPGNILGAARYSVEEGLIPSSIELVRGTTSGGVYNVIFFTNFGDKGFDLSEDTLIEGISTAFSAS